MELPTPITRDPKSTSKFHPLEIITELPVTETKEIPPTPTPRINTQRKSRCSTFFTLANFGFHAELSHLQKLLLFCCGVMAGYGAFSPAESTGNDIVALVMTPDETSAHVIKGIAVFAAIIVVFSTWKGMGIGLHNLQQYSALLEAHGEQLVALQKRARLKTGLIRGLTSDLSALTQQVGLLEEKAERLEASFERHERRASTSLTASLFSVRMRGFTTEITENNESEDSLCIITNQPPKPE